MANILLLVGSKLFNPPLNLMFTKVIRYKLGFQRPKNIKNDI